MSYNSTQPDVIRENTRNQCTVFVCSLVDTVEREINSCLKVTQQFTKNAAVAFTQLL